MRQRIGRSVVVSVPLLETTASYKPDKNSKSDKLLVKSKHQLQDGSLHYKGSLAIVWPFSIVQQTPAAPPV